MTQCPAFRQIAPPLDVDDGTLANLADQLGVPTMVKPAAKTPPVAHQPPQDTPKPEPRPAPSAKPKDSPAAKKPAPALMPPRSPLEKLTLEIPRYLIDAIKRDAIDRHTTARHVLMLALQGAGFEIHTADLVPDARRRKTVKP
jgi:hypothetical protein